MSEELYNSHDYCLLAEQYEELKKENAELTADKIHLMNLFMESSEYVFDVISNMKINDLEQKCKALEADYVISNRELLILQQRIAELEEAIKGHDPFEEFPPKERGFECSVMVLGKFEYEEEFTTFTNWDLCVYWFDEERWHPLNGYVKGDDIVRWYALPPEVQ